MMRFSDARIVSRISAAVDNLFQKCMVEPPRPSGRIRSASPEEAIVTVPRPGRTPPAIAGQQARTVDVYVSSAYGSSGTRKCFANDGTSRNST